MLLFTHLFPAQPHELMISLLRRCLVELRIPRCHSRDAGLSGQEPTWAAGLGSEGLHRARRGLKIVVPGGVGIFLGRGVIERSSIQVGAVGQELAEVHSSAGREKFVKDQTGSVLSLEAA